MMHSYRGSSGRNSSRWLLYIVILLIGANIALLVLRSNDSDPLEKYYESLVKGAARPDEKFPSRERVASDLEIGMSKQDVIERFGNSLHVEAHPEQDAEVLYYHSPPSYQPDESGFGGFMVVIQEGKVAAWHPILRGGH